MQKQNIKANYTDEFLLNELKRYYDEFGKTPSLRQLDENKNYPSVSAYRNRFGSLENALHMVGLFSFRENQKLAHEYIKIDCENGVSLEDIAIKYKLDKKYVNEILNGFGIKFRTDLWADEDFLYLKDNINKLSNIEIAFNLRKSLSSVAYKCSNSKLNNKVIYYFPDYICNEKESFLFNIVKDRLKDNELIDSITIEKITNIKSVSTYCKNLYGMSYENFLLTFLNIEYHKYITDNCIKLHNLLLDNKVKCLSNSFWTFENICIISKHIFNNILKWTQKDFYEKYSSSLLIKYKLYHTIIKHKTILEFLFYIYPELDNNEFMYRKVVLSNNYWDNKENRISAIDFLFNKLNISVNEMPKTINFSHFKGHLNGLMKSRSIIDIINEYTEYKYNIKFNEWEFNCVPNYFWYDNNNIKKAIKWMLEEKENWNGTDTNWLINNYSAKLFKKHNLSGLLSSSDEISLLNLLYITYPNIDIFHWEFNLVSRNYWSKENAKIALKQLIQNRLKMNIHDIPKAISMKYFNIYYPKFIPLVYDYFGNLYNWINEIYPDMFTCRDFGYIECIDGTIVKSHTEQVIHNYLISKYRNVKYINNVKINNGIYSDENYYPDWIIDNNYVLEYLGLFKKDKKKVTSKTLLKYYNKTLKKIDISKNIEEYEFIFIYENDLLQELTGLKDKLSIININKNIA